MEHVFRSARVADLEVKSCFTTVLGSRLHHFEARQGRPVLFLNDNPSWSYIWRNVLPHVAPAARCIALDHQGPVCPTSRS